MLSYSTGYAPTIRTATHSAFAVPASRRYPTYRRRGWLDLLLLIVGVA